MSKLDDIIAQKAYELDCLMALRNIYQTKDCNECKNRDCGYMPKPGQMVRYNCPFFEEKKKEEQT